MADQNEQDDLAGSLRGDGEAYARIVARHQQQVAARMRHFSRQPHIREELVQEVFVAAYYSLPGYRATGPLAAWLMRIATRVGYRHWQQQGRAKEQVREESWWRELSERSIEQLNPTRAAELVQQLLERLPPRDRLVMLLLYAEGRTIDEAAQLSGWSKTMVKVQAFRARKKLKAVLAAAGIENLAGLANAEIDSQPPAKPEK